MKPSQPTHRRIELFGHGMTPGSDLEGSTCVCVCVFLFKCFLGQSLGSSFLQNEDLDNHPME